MKVNYQEMIKDAGLRLLRHEGGREECGSQTRNGSPLGAGSSGEGCSQPAETPRGGCRGVHTLTSPLLPLVRCWRLLYAKPNRKPQDKRLCGCSSSRSVS